MKPKVLFVDDERGVHAAWKLQLADLGDKVEIVQAFTVDEAIEQFKANPDLAAIVLDGYLSGHSTVPEALALIKEFSPTFTGPMISVSSDEFVRMRCVAMGCTHECQKRDLPRRLIAILKL